MGTQTFLYPKAKLRVSLTRRPHVLEYYLYLLLGRALESHCPACEIRYPLPWALLQSHWKTNSLRQGLLCLFVFAAKSLVLRVLPVGVKIQLIPTKWRNLYSTDDSGHTQAPSQRNTSKFTGASWPISSFPSLWILAASYITDRNRVFFPSPSLNLKIIVLSPNYMI